MPKLFATAKQGLIAGLIGFATVAVLMFIVDLAAGRPPLYSAAALGSALFSAASDPTQVTITAATVLGYSVVHLVVFLAFGLIAAALASLADRGRQLWFIGLFFFIFVSFHMFGAVQALATPMRTALSEPMLWAAGVAAAAMIALYLFHAHPRIRAEQAW